MMGFSAGRAVLSLAAGLVLAAGGPGFGMGPSLESLKQESGRSFGEDGPAGRGRFKAVSMAVAPLASAARRLGPAAQSPVHAMATAAIGPMEEPGLAVPAVPEPVPVKPAEGPTVDEGRWAKAGMVLGALATAGMYVLAGPAAQALYNLLASSGLIGGFIGSLAPSSLRGDALRLAAAAALAALALNPGMVAALGFTAALIASVGSAVAVAAIVNEARGGGGRDPMARFREVVGSALAGAVLGATAPVWAGGLIGRKAAGWLAGRRP